MRLFIAIELEKGLIDKIASVQEKLASGDYDLKMVEPRNLHLTLKFLGDIHEEQLMKVENIISSSLRGFHDFGISFEGIGYFGDESFIKVVWAGVKDGKEGLINLAKELDKNLSFIRKDEHGPSPHLTIARVKSRRNAKELGREIRAMQGVKLGEFRVKEIKLKKSVLLPQGPEYADVKAFPLDERKVSRDAFSPEKERKASAGAFNQE